MKKITFLSFAILGILAFSGCNKPVERPPSPINDIPKNAAIPPELPLEIETSVDSLDSYSSPDELLDDIDTAMKDLDNL